MKPCITLSFSSLLLSPLSLAISSGFVMTKNFRSWHLVLSQLARNKKYEREKREKNNFTYKIFGVFLHNENLDLQLGTASHQWKEEGQLAVNVPGCGNYAHVVLTCPLYPPNLQRLADPSLLVVDVAPVAVHVQHLEAVPLIDSDIARTLYRKLTAWCQGCQQYC